MIPLHSSGTRMCNWLQAMIVCVACIALSSCGKTIKWKQEVQLHDGRVIVVERVSKQTGRTFPENVIIEYEQKITFTNPITNEQISWALPKGTLAKLLDFEGSVPYLVLRPASVADYNEWGCPNPPFLIFRYKDDEWHNTSIRNLPSHFNRPNLLDAAHSADELSADGVVTIEEMEIYLKNSMFPESRVISREQINPVGKGCHIDTLVKQGRKSEARIGYPTQGG